MYVTLDNLNNKRDAAVELTVGTREKITDLGVAKLVIAFQYISYGQRVKLSIA